MRTETLGGSGDVFTDPPAHVDILSLRFAVRDKVIFDGLSARIPEGAITTILGASGSGKSTLLRMIACLQKPDYGDIWVGDQEITCMPESQAMQFRRRIGMLFQGGALLDSMTVFENVALALREHTRMAEDEIRERVHQACLAVDLKNVDDLLPAQLSGGMVKRVALARAMILEPQILLCDEPFSGLDPVTHRKIERLLVETQDRIGATMVVTNHDIASTMRMSDQIVFLAGGAAIAGPVREIQHSVDPRVVAFLKAASPEPIDRDAPGLEEDRGA